MFQSTIDLLRGQDRKGAKIALKKELKALSEADIERQLDALQRQAEEQEKIELSLARAKKDELQRVAKVDAAKAKLTASAEAFDTLAIELERSFHEIEVQLMIISENSPQDRVSVARLRWLLVGAMWHSAKELSTRLGISRSPGGQHKWKPMKDALAAQIQIKSERNRTK